MKPAGMAALSFFFLILEDKVSDFQHGLVLVMGFPLAFV